MGQHDVRNLHEAADGSTCVEARDAQGQRPWLKKSIGLINSGLQIQACKRIQAFERAPGPESCTINGVEPDSLASGRTYPTDPFHTPSRVKINGSQAVLPFTVVQVNEVKLLRLLFKSPQRLHTNHNKISENLRTSSPTMTCPRMQTDLLHSPLGR